MPRFPAEYGAGHRGTVADVTDRDARLAAASATFDWDESLHERDERGRFGPGGAAPERGGGSPIPDVLPADGPSPGAGKLSEFEWKRTDPEPEDADYEGPTFDGSATVRSAAGSDLEAHVRIASEPDGSEFRWEAEIERETGGPPEPPRANGVADTLEAAQADAVGSIAEAVDGYEKELRDQYPDADF